MVDSKVGTTEVVTASIGDTERVIEEVAGLAEGDAEVVTGEEGSATAKISFCAPGAQLVLQGHRDPRLNSPLFQPHFML